MYRPQIDITIGSHKFNFVTAFKTVSSWKNFTDTGQMTIPTKFKKDNQTIIVGNDNVFKRGDAIEISCGFFPKKDLIFKGFVSKIIPKLPLIIQFEDYTWILKQTNVTFSLESTSLKSMLQTAISEAKKKASGIVLQTLGKIKLDCVDAQLGSFRVTRVSLVNILEELKKTYALTSFFVGDTLHCGLTYSSSLGSNKNFDFDFEQDVVDDSNLEYVRIDDVRIKIKAISMLPNNKKIEVDAGDPDGEQRTLFKYNLTQSELKNVADREADKFRYEGWRGSFRALMTDVIKHGDTVTLSSKRLPERNGKYYVDMCEGFGGVDGYFNEIHLGAKVSAGVNAF